MIALFKTPGPFPAAFFLAACSSARRWTSFSHSSSAAWETNLENHYKKMTYAIFTEEIKIVFFLFSRGRGSGFSFSNRGGPSFSLVFSKRGNVIPPTGNMRVFGAIWSSINLGEYFNICTRWSVTLYNNLEIL